MEEKREKMRLAKQKQEQERAEKSKRKLIDMNPTQNQEGVMDRFVLFYFYFSDMFNLTVIS